MNEARTTGLGVLLAGLLAGCAGDPSATVFDPEVLHEVAITVAKGDLESLATDAETRVLCDVTYDGVSVSGAGIRQKGGTLFALDDKPSFSIKLDTTDEDAQIGGLHKILLSSSKQDPTFFHEQLASGMFLRAGVPAARTAHAKVRLNGEVLGVYVVVEAIDKPFLRRHFGEKNDDGNLYEGSCCGDFTDDLTRLDLDNEAEEGRMRFDLLALGSAIVDAKDEDLPRLLEERMDLGGFLTTHALEAVFDHWDGYSYRLNNYYLYDNPANGRFVFLPHGMDRVLEHPAFDPEVLPVARLPRRLRANPAEQARWRSEMARVWTLWDEEAVFAELDQVGALVHGAGSESAIADDVKDFDKSVETFRQILKQRRLLTDPSIPCGDGKIQGLETCDDGNTQGGDGCSARCRLEP